MTKELGSKLRVKSIDWYEQNKNEYGDVVLPNGLFTSAMSKYCGQQAVITSFSGPAIYIDLDDEEWLWSDLMFECQKEKPELKNVE